MFPAASMPKNHGSLGRPHAVTVGDVNPDALDRIAQMVSGVDIIHVDVASPSELAKSLEDPYLASDIEFVCRGEFK